MKKQLFTGFNTRQYMTSDDFEVFYYNDLKLNHVSPHDHPNYEFYFFLEGDTDYWVDGQQYSLKYGDFLMIPPTILHYPIFRTQDTPYRRFVLWISKDCYQELCRSSSDFSYGFDHAARSATYRYHTDFMLAQELQGRLMELIEETNSTRPFHESNARLLSASLLLQVNRIIYDQAHQVSPSYENVLYLNICDYINNHLSDDLTLDSLAAFFYVSKYHISHVFKDNMGISPHQYIQKKRLQACKNGILSGTPFSNVYHQYGFHDYTAFYRAFKKEFGLSPKEFREQYHLSREYL